MVGGPAHTGEGGGVELVHVYRYGNIQYNIMAYKKSGELKICVAVQFLIFF